MLYNIDMYNLWRWILSVDEKQQKQYDGKKRETARVDYNTGPYYSFMGWGSKSFFTNAFNNRYCNRKNTLLFILFRMKLPFHPSTLCLSTFVLDALNLRNDTGTKGHLYIKEEYRKTTCAKCKLLRDAISISIFCYF